MIGTVRIDPELEHTTWCMEGSRHRPLAPKLSDIPQVNENDDVVVEPSLGRFGVQGFDFTFRSFQERLVSELHLSPIRSPAL